MVRAKFENGTFSSSIKKIFGEPPLFLSFRRKPKSLSLQRAPRIRIPRVPIPTVQISLFRNETNYFVTYREPAAEDLPKICSFVDFWLSGGAKKLGIPGGGADYFVPKKQQADYLKYKTTLVAEINNSIVGWAVKSQNKTLIHLLVDSRWRGFAIGTTLLKILDPEFVRSKSDQSTGNPLSFYEKLGYKIIDPGTGKKHNIDVLKKE